MDIIYNEVGEKVIVIKKDIDTSYSSHNMLGKFAMEAENTKDNQLVVDLSNVRFIASNQFAILGCIMGKFVAEHGEDSLLVQGINAKIEAMTQKNGFCRHFGIDGIMDVHNTVIPYKIFNVDEINEYEKYLTMSLFSRNDLPTMTQSVKNSIQDYLLELFKNVNDHTTSNKIYTCGHFFPQKSFLYFTIVDSGETIPYNVKKYIKKYNLGDCENHLAWALKAGNSTRDLDTPGGLGLALIKNFISLNAGELHIISGNDIFEHTRRGERYQKLNYSFPGTIVTLAFNLGDQNMYYLSNENIEEIQF